ncbi:MAG TPA: hypothetical protein VFU45_00870 [Gemmatimonadales bacterium]|nr:hypothetical protein [Gemmatimonadales bacterium]
MTSCEGLQERMPAVARDEDRWSAADLAHVRGCAECSAEWSVVEGTVRLGHATPAVDPGRTAAAVVRRLGADRVRARVRRRWVGGAVGVAAAAALAFVLWPAARPAPAAPVELQASVFLPELDSLTVDQLKAVLGAVDRPLGSDRTLDSSGLSGLSDDELSAVLQSMEG